MFFWVFMATNCFCQHWWKQPQWPKKRPWTLYSSTPTFVLSLFYCYNPNLHLQTAVYYHTHSFRSKTGSVTIMKELWGWTFGSHWRLLLMATSIRERWLHSKVVVIAHSTHPWQGKVLMMLHKHPREDTQHLLNETFIGWYCTHTSVRCVYHKTQKLSFV